MEGKSRRRRGTPRDLKKTLSGEEGSLGDVVLNENKIFEEGGCLTLSDELQQDANDRVNACGT